MKWWLLLANLIVTWLWLALRRTEVYGNGEDTGNNFE